MEDKIRVLVSEEEVDRRIAQLGKEISEAYAGKSVHLICVLKGGVFFTCELAKRITVPVSLDFMSVSSYGADTKSSGVVKIIKDLDEPLEGKDVLIVEDIIDSGTHSGTSGKAAWQQESKEHFHLYSSGQTGASCDRCESRLCGIQYPR